MRKADMEDATLTQLFARMDAHLERQDVYLARQDAHLSEITETLRHQNALMIDVGRQLAETSRFVVEAMAAQNATLAGLTRLLIRRRNGWSGRGTRGPDVSNLATISLTPVRS
jgi:hypothetical protein